MYTRLPVSMTTAVSPTCHVASWHAITDMKRQAFNFSYDVSEAFIVRFRVI